MTSRSLRARGTATALLLVAATLAGCGDPAADAGRPDAAPTQLRVPATTDGTALSEQGAWWAEGVLHLGDRTVEVGPIRSFAVAGRTVAYVGDGGDLCFTDLADRACSGFRPSGDLVVSPDGDHLGFLDSALGEQDRFDTPLLTSTVIELSTGRVVASSTQGMGDVDEDDLADLYEDAWPHLSGFDGDGAALVSSASGDPVRLPVDGTAPSALPYDPTASDLPGQTARDLPGETVTIRREGGTVTTRSGRPNDSISQGRLSPDGEVVVLSAPSAISALRVADTPTGTPAALTGQRDPWWSFGGWTGPHDFLATTLDAAQTTYGIYRCDGAARECELVQEVSTGGRGIDAVVFATTAGSDVVSLSDP